MQVKAIITDLDRTLLRMDGQVSPYTLAGGDLVQVMSRRATKWRGIIEMLRAFGIAKEEAVYFGDDYDDLEPVEKCGLGVAVANAVEVVKERADAVAGSCDEDGAARFIASRLL